MSKSTKNRLELLLHLLEEQKQLEIIRQQPMTEFQTRMHAKKSYEVETALSCFYEYEINCVKELLKPVVDPKDLKEKLEQARENITEKHKVISKAVGKEAGDTEWKTFLRMFLILLMLSSKRFADDLEAVIVCKMLEAFFELFDDLPENENRLTSGGGI